MGLLAMYTGKIVRYKSYMESLQILYRIPMQVIENGKPGIRADFLGFVSGKILSTVKHFYNFFTFSAEEKKLRKKLKKHFLNF
jgi:hypothetical protein